MKKLKDIIERVLEEDVKVEIDAKQVLNQWWFLLKDKYGNESYKIGIPQNTTFWGDIGDLIKTMGSYSQIKRSENQWRDFFNNKLFPIFVNGMEIERDEDFERNESKLRSEFTNIMWELLVGDKNVQMGKDRINKLQKLRSGQSDLSLEKTNGRWSFYLRNESEKEGTRTEHGAENYQNKGEIDV